MREYFGLLTLIFAVQAAHADALPQGEYMPPFFLEADVMRMATIPEPMGLTHVCGAFIPSGAGTLHPQAGPLLAFTITLDGTLKNITVTQSSGVELLDKAALACANTWKYKPATFRGTPFEVDWKNNVGWTQPEPVAPGRMPDVIATPGKPDKSIATQSVVPPPNAAMAPIGTFYGCIRAAAGSVPGMTIVGFTLTDHATVENMSVLKSSGYQRLDQAVASCTQEMLYRSARSHGKPLPVTWRGNVQWIVYYE
jgi:TonB family protein